MATITYRTTDEKWDKLAELASEQSISVNKFIDELITIALTERNTYLRFAARASRGDPNATLKIFNQKHLQNRGCWDS